MRGVLARWRQRHGLAVSATWLAVKALIYVVLLLTSSEVVLVAYQQF